MRKIESQMIQAIQGNRNWSNANTSVTFDPETGDSKVYLHGNHIATVTEDSLEMFDGGCSPSPLSPASMPFVMPSASPGKAFSKRTGSGTSAAWLLNPPSPARCSTLMISPTVTCSPEQPAHPAPSGVFYL